ncbi:MULTISPECIES: Zn-ribbon domain-containing protein [Halorussus]|uniref:Zn-ribbon domain-containing protein n=1 Tax=Halorussus TaxID=1070314 RepID=UPI0020A0AE26|nr:Zn-ribbon domain-containing protein [Halorussus vallis]USZ74167.1 Zn-ribbon domain-containing protein [Halorussus vallis]
MPHQCTTCGRTFADGSKQMLSGCPDCGGNKFQFLPAGAVDDGGAGAGGARAGGTEPKKAPERSPDATGRARDAPETRGDAGRRDAGSSADTGGTSNAVNRAAATVREWVSQRGDDDPSASSRNAAASRDAPANSNRGAVGGADLDDAENTAQASARRDVVTRDELPDPGERRGVAEGDAPETEGNVVSAPDDHNPGLEELREELNSQFESIRIVNPGQYELNLMELYEREEYIISLREDGKYVIEVPDAWERVGDR